MKVLKDKLEIIRNTNTQCAKPTIILIMVDLKVGKNPNNFILLAYQ